MTFKWVYDISKHAMYHYGGESIIQYIFLAFHNDPFFSFFFSFLQFFDIKN
jgi:cytochrome b involved in lipid metabolism